MSDRQDPKRVVLPEDLVSAMGPYANWDPKKDPYLQSKPPPKVTQNPLDYFKGYVAGWPGAIGDLHESLRPINLLQAPIPTSEELGQALGADTESVAFKVGTIGLPGFDDALLKLGPLAGSVIAWTKRSKSQLARYQKDFDKWTDKISAYDKNVVNPKDTAFKRKWGVKHRDAPAMFDPDTGEVNEELFRVAAAVRNKGPIDPNKVRDMLPEFKADIKAQNEVLNTRSEWFSKQVAAEQKINRWVADDATERFGFSVNATEVGDEHVKLALSALDEVDSLEIGKLAGSNQWAFFDKTTGYMDTDMPTFANKDTAQRFLDKRLPAVYHMERMEGMLDQNSAEYINTHMAARWLRSKINGQ